MMSLIRSHLVLTYYALVVAISWGGSRGSAQSVELGPAKPDALQ